jgi:hypothetical protein
MARNWTRQLYAAEDSLRLLSDMPFTDMSEAAAASRSIMQTQTWKDACPRPIEVFFEGAKTWEESAGARRDRIRKIRGRDAFIITLGMGVKAFGCVLHEDCHLPFYNHKELHGDDYVRLYIRLWGCFSRKPWYDQIVAALSEYGIPVEELS